jgi:signal transduction histidine kinase
MTASAAELEAARAGWWRFRDWPGRLFDLGVVLALLAVGVAILLSSTNEIPRLSAIHTPWFIAVVVPLASLLVRRRYPLVTMGVILAALIAEAALRSPIIVQPLVLVAVYTVASRLPWRTSLVISLVTYGAYLAAEGLSRGEATFPLAVTALVPLGAAYVVGAYVGTRVAYVDSLQARAAQLVRERDLLAQQAVAEERVRIARELHDVVAHHLSLITVQAGALQTQLNAGEPAYATAQVIARSGRQAMDEMRRMLGVLRLGDGSVSPGHAPQPGVADIPGLIEQARAAGVETTLRVEGDAQPLPPAIDLSAYRIVQEALTNVLRHAGPVRCTVQLRYGTDALEVRITDDGRIAADAVAHAGHGLIGMRERVALFGGQLFAGAVPDGGWAVQATLPLHRGAAATT